MKHTPGPWRVTEESDFFNVFRAYDDTPEALALLDQIRAIDPNAWEACTDGSVTTIAELRDALDYMLSMD
jgi:hypothetical protein